MRLFNRSMGNLFGAMGVAGSLCMLVGCAGDLSEELDKPGNGTQTGTPIIPGQSGRVTNTQGTGGVVTSQINAMDQTSWVYFQFAGAKEVMPQDPLNSTDWDVALLRFQLKVNGGISGRGGVEVALATGTLFAALSQAPSSGYVTDQVDGADEDADPDYAFVQGGTWYNYNAMTHILTPKEQVYVVRATTGKYYKMQITGYYDQAGSSGFPAFRWQPTPAP